MNHNNNKFNEKGTTGILLRRLTTDRFLVGTSHVIVDEVHERDIDTDFLLILLRDLVSLRAKTDQPLKLLLMSATAQIDQLVRYMSSSSSSSSSSSMTMEEESSSYTSEEVSSSFSSLSLIKSQGDDYALPTRVIEISGRTFPVTMCYMEDIWKKLKRSGRPPTMKLPRSSSNISSDSGGSGKDNNNNKQNDKRTSRSMQGKQGGGGSGRAEEGSSQDAIEEEDEEAKKELKMKESLVFNSFRDLSPLVEEKLDYDLIVSLIDELTSSSSSSSSSHAPSGAILVFLPGVRDIEVLMRALRSHKDGELKKRCHLLSLHGSLTINEQRRVFQPTPKGIFKVWTPIPLCSS
jgi:ATP-dependent RNA helicase DHX29